MLHYLLLPLLPLTHLPSNTLPQLVALLAHALHLLNQQRVQRPSRQLDHLLILRHHLNQPLIKLPHIVFPVLPHNNQLFFYFFYPTRTVLLAPLLFLTPLLNHTTLT
jgi:hypothetical protein